MILDNIGLSSLRVFEEVYRQGNMSKASKSLFMTQPGVSQHIKSLELELGVKLFDRVGRNLVVTPAGSELYEKISPILLNLSESLEGIAIGDSELTGSINFGMPIEFGNNVILPLLSKWANEHKLVKININYDHITRQVDSMLDGSLDFVIADSFNLTKQLESKILAKEHLVLCCSNEYAKEFDLNNFRINQIKDLSFIDYLNDGMILKQWFEHHYKKRIDIETRVALFDVQGMARLISNHMGLGILPMHVIRRNKLEDRLTIIKEKASPLYNEMSFVNIKERTMNNATLSFINYLDENLN